MNRRSLILGAAATAALPPLATAAVSAGAARRSFRILRAGSDIGRHELSARATTEGFEIEISIDIAVRVLGFTAYRYGLENREVWRGGRLVRLESRVNDDGTAEYARVVQGRDALEIDGSGFSGTAPMTAVPTSYYVPAFLERRPWISTQSGRPLEIAARKAGTGPVRWRIEGELETQLLYDAEGEWLGSEFDAGGETARYELTGAEGAIGPLWQAA